MLSKEEIIKELQNCAKENGDRTPSEKVFYEYAEIGIYDLHKHGWPNYGELVVKAGLTPNKFDRTRYSHDQLCEMFIKTIREKGKWPTGGELDVKHHNDSNFPNSATFYKKLGLTRVLAQTVLEFVKGRRRYNDISDICNGVLGEYKDQDTSPEGATLATGFVYLIKGQFKQYKIGETDDVERRMYELTQGPVKPELIHKIETDDRKGVEKYWHQRFENENKQIRGEWFKLTPSDVSAFRRWKKIS